MTPELLDKLSPVLRLESAAIAALIGRQGLIAGLASGEVAPPVGTIARVADAARAGGVQRAILLERVRAIRAELSLAERALSRLLIDEALAAVPGK